MLGFTVRAYRAGCKGNLPYSAPPHDLVADPRLTPTDVRVAAALLYWARSKASCWPSDATIGMRVGRSPGTVQRSLRRLEQAGWIRREKTTANRTGRLIVLAWRVAGTGTGPIPIARGKNARPAESPAAGARPAPPPVTGPPAAPAREELRRYREGDSAKEPRGDRPERSRPEPDGAAPGPCKGPVEAQRGPAPPAWSIPAAEVRGWSGSADPILRAEAERRLAPRPRRPAPPATVPELLARIRESAAHVAAAAELLCQDLDDRKSWSGFHAACRRAWSGEIAPAALVAAWSEATSGRARVPGAVFMAVLRRESRG